MSRKLYLKTISLTSENRHGKSVLSLVSVWLLLNLYFPAFYAFGFHIRLDYPLLLFMIGWVLLHGKIHVGSLVVATVGIFFAFLLAISTYRGLELGYPVRLPLILGVIKPFFVTIVWLEVLKRITIHRAYRIISLVFIPAALLSIGQGLYPEIFYDFTMEHYVTEGRSQVAERLLNPESGLTTRSVAMFDTPAYAGVAFLVALMASLAFMRKSRVRSQRRIYGILGLGYLVAGVFTLSSLFFGGVALFFTGLFVGLPTTRERGSNFSKLSVIVTVVIFVIAIFVMIKFMGQDAMRELGYRVGRVLTGEVLLTRFGEGGGLLDVLSNWHEFALLGIGGTRTPYFLSDNLYLVAWARYGIIAMIGLVLMGLFFFWKFLKEKDQLRRWQRLAGLVLLAAGLGIPLVWVPRSSEVVVFFLVVAIFSGRISTKYPTSGSRAQTHMEKP